MSSFVYISKITSFLKCLIVGIFIFLCHCSYASEPNSDVFFLSVDNTSGTKEHFAVYENLTVASITLGPRAEAFLEITQRTGLHTLRATYKLGPSRKTYRIAKVSVEPTIELHYEQGAPLTNDSALFYGISEAPPAAETRVAALKPADDFIPATQCADLMGKYTPLVRALKDAGNLGYFSSGCSLAQKKQISSELSEILDTAAPGNICFKAGYPAVWGSFQSYWGSKLTNSKEKPFIECDKKHASSSIKDGSITLGSDVSWNGSNEDKAVLQHEMIHVVVADEKKDQEIAKTCGSFDKHENTVILSSAAAKKNAQAVLVTEPQSSSPSQIQYQAVNPESVSEIHQFIANNAGSAAVISAVATKTAARVASELSVLPEARAALHGDGAADGISGIVTSFDSLNRPTVAFSNGKNISFSHPFPDIPIEAVTAATRPSTGSQSETLAALTRADVRGPASGGSGVVLAAPTASGTSANGGIVGSSTLSSLSLRGSASVDPELIRTPADARVALVNQPSLLKQQPFVQRLSDLKIQVVSGQNKWGATQPQYRWSLEQMLKARSQP